MKYCLSSRQTSEYLGKASGVRVQWRDRESIIDLIEKYPNLEEISLDVPWTDKNWPALENYQKLCQGKFIIRIADLRDAVTAVEKGIPFYYHYEVHTFYELEGLEELGASEIIIGAPLTHMLPKVKEVTYLPIRVVANIAYEDLIPHKNGICGQWMRPEDMDFYSNYIDFAEFKFKDREQEQALFRIYAEQKNWPGDLSMIIDNLNFTATNRMIPGSLAVTRSQCGQRCLSGGACQLCKRILTVANPELVRGYIKSQEDSVD